MSGHSKWSQIKRKKAITDGKRGKMFTRFIKEIQISARIGGADPDGNPRLRFAIETAKRNSMPLDNITRAIARGAGLDGGQALDELTYEVYAPGGVAIIVETATDNKNRTVGEVRHILSKYGGNLAETGSVSWMFSKRGVIIVPKEGNDEDALLMLALDAGADDVKTEDEDYFEIRTTPESFDKVRDAISTAGLHIEEAKLGLVPENLVMVAPLDVDKVTKLLDVLEDNEDVQNVFSNAEFPE
jgi:YebC/PmpR family DNA-binding regulatory protein